MKFVNFGRNILDKSRLDKGYVITMQEAVVSYEISGVDLSQRNKYRLTFDQIGFADGIKGNWIFEFTADGTELITDTRHISTGREYQLPDGVKVTLEELTLNELEQRISYSKSGAAGAGRVNQ